jgi:hypothetical protein
LFFCDHSNEFFFSFKHIYMTSKINHRCKWINSLTHKIYSFSLSLLLSFWSMWTGEYRVVRRKRAVIHEWSLWLSTYVILIIFIFFILKPWIIVVWCAWLGLQIQLQNSHTPLYFWHNVKLQFALCISFFLCYSYNLVKKNIVLLLRILCTLCICCYTRTRPPWNNI